MPFPRIVQGGGGGGGASYDDTALAARVTALEADILYNRRTGVDGTDAGPSSSILVTGLSGTKTNLVVIHYTATGSVNHGSMEFEPADTAGGVDAASASMKLTAASAWASDSAKCELLQANAILASVAASGISVKLTIEIDSVLRKGWWRLIAGSGTVAGTISTMTTGCLQWTDAAITSFRLTCLTASATMTASSWKGWTEV